MDEVSQPFGLCAKQRSRFKSLFKYTMHVIRLKRNCASLNILYSYPHVYNMRAKSVAFVFCYYALSDKRMPCLRRSFATRAA